MALFERKPEESVTGDAATRALSVTAVENDFVEAVYDKLSIVYDLTFGPIVSVVSGGIGTLVVVVWAALKFPEVRRHARLDAAPSGHDE